MVDDVVRALGYATLGSRLKRIGEKLQAQTQELCALVSGTDLPTPHNPVLAALDRYGALSIGEIAAALGQSQPGVTRMINRMKADGLVSSQPSEQDRRITNIALTKEGRAFAARMKETLWPEVMLAVEDACSGLDGSLLDQLDQLEDALDARALAGRRAHPPLPDWETILKRTKEKK